MKKTLHLFSMLFVATTACLQVACSDHDPAKDDPQIRQVTGDPIVFVKGSDFDRSGLPADLVKMETSWEMSASGFNQRKLKSYEDVKNEQAPENAKRSNDPTVYEFKTSSEGRHTLQPSADDIVEAMTKSQDHFIPSFKEKEGRLIMDQLHIGGTDLLAEANVEVLHYSARPDLSAFSVLIYATDDTAKLLLALYFTLKQEPSLLRITENAYNYIRGRGVEIGWAQDQALNINVCNLPYNGIHKMVQEGIEAWNKPLLNRLELKATKADSCPPFSDVNSRNFAYVDDWIEIRGQAAVAGFTTSQVQLTASQFVDSDIFILKAEFQESFKEGGIGWDTNDGSIYEKPELFKAMGRTVTHEIGHLLGLHHVFDGTSSIMSYDRSDDSITPYDYEAIQNLYPSKDDLKL